MDDFIKIFSELNLIFVIKNLNNDIVYSNSITGKVLSEFNLNSAKREIYYNNIYYQCIVQNINIDNNQYKLEIYNDITKYILKVEELSKDYLTNLANRHEIYKQLSIIEKESKDKLEPYCIVIGDIDFFKKINDTYGHLAGDKILISISEILSENIRINDFVGRFGGEEFIIIMKNTTSTIAYEIIENIRKKIEMNKFYINDNNKYISDITMTFGISQSHDIKILDVLKESDLALYNGKNNGRNRCVIYNESMY